LLSEIQKIVLNIEHQIIPHLNVTTGEWGLVWNEIPVQKGAYQNNI
jgi:hypothetical protein